MVIALIKKSEITKLSDDIRKIIDGQESRIRDNKEGVWGALKNDIHTLATRNSEQLESFRRERDLMSDTLANISHQLKTPLASMTLMAGLIENAPDEKREEFISNIKISLMRMEWLVSALLKMAKLDSGSVKFNKENIKSGELIKLALDPLQILLDLKGQSAEISGETEIFCDKRWTAEALTNVLKNASEHSPFGRNNPRGIR